MGLYPLLSFQNRLKSLLLIITENGELTDADGNWEPITDYYDIRKENPKYKAIRAKAIGRIPYYNIVDFISDGDEYTSEPHLFCKFDNDGMPYEEIYYKSEGDPKKEISDWDFDRKKRTTFPKE